MSDAYHTDYLPEDLDAHDDPDPDLDDALTGDGAAPAREEGGGLAA